MLAFQTKNALESTVSTVVESMTETVATNCTFEWQSFECLFTDDDAIRCIFQRISSELPRRLEKRKKGKDWIKGRLQHNIKG